MKFSTLLLLSTFTGSNAFYNSHDIITHDDGSVHLFEKTQHRRLTTKNLKVNSDTTNTKFTVHGSEYITMNLHVDGYTTLGGLEFEDAGAFFGDHCLTALAGPGITVDNGKLTAIALGTTSGTALVGSTTTISTTQSDAIIANTAKTGITTTQSDAITANTNAIATNTANINTNIADISTNTANINHNTGMIASVASTTITPAQASEITANNAKTGITTVQSDAITANTNAIATNTANINTNIADISTNIADINHNTGMIASVASTTITPAQASEITANNAKTGITTVQSDAIAANTAKLVLTAAADSGIAIDVAGAISANVATGVIKDALDAIEAADTVTAVQKEYRLERMVLLLCNTLGIKYEHLVRAVDEVTFNPYERFSAIQVNDDDLYSTDSNSKLVDVTAVSTALCSTKTDVACPTGYSNKHALAMCATGTCASSDFTASGLCCVPN